ncbi:hypothetical protein HanIR_Chr07g0324881 [Helianthus annuus]|nr:hypothetical protein HanIR_Chr07g0324881 [Helianthus annuus]
MHSRDRTFSKGPGRNKRNAYLLAPSLSHYNRHTSKGASRPNDVIKVNWYKYLHQVHHKYDFLNLRSNSLYFLSLTNTYTHAGMWSQSGPPTFATNLTVCSVCRFRSSSFTKV